MRLPCRLLLFALSMMALPAAAQTAIHRCIGSTGNPVFTDQPCATMQATPVRAAPAREDTSPGTPQLLCAASPDDLRQHVIEAFAQQDVNQLAGLMLWGGYGHGAAIADIRSLTGLVRQPLLGVDLHDDSPTADGGAMTGLAAGSASADPSAPASLILEFAGQTGTGVPLERRFDMVRRAGCLWLRNAD